MGKMSKRYTLDYQDDRWKVVPAPYGHRPTTTKYWVAYRVVAWANDEKQKLGLLDWKRVFEKFREIAKDMGDASFEEPQ
jgi:hypothetical protein